MKRIILKISRHADTNLKKRKRFFKYQLNPRQIIDFKKVVNRFYIRTSLFYRIESILRTPCIKKSILRINKKILMSVNSNPH